MNIFKKTALFLGLLCPLLAGAQEKFTIKGQVSGPIEGPASFARYTLKQGQKIDHITIVNEKFTFEGNLYTNEPEMGKIIFNNGGANAKSLSFYLEPGEINIDCAIGKSNVKISGTPLNVALQELNDMFSVILDNINGNQEGRSRYNRFSPEVQDQAVETIGKFAGKHTASLVSLDALKDMVTYGSNISKPNQNKLNAIFKGLSSALKNSEKGKEFASKIKGFGISGVGDMAPLFSMADTSGRMVSLKEFRGKYVLLDFWATWCGPCLEEMPNVADAYQKYKNKNFTVVGISMDRPDSKEKWLSLIKKNGYNWPQLSDLKWWNCEAALLYNVNSAPSNFLIDPKGKIIATNLRGPALQQKLAEILNEKAGG